MAGAKFDTGAHAEHARATLAKHIIEAAKQGELDQRRLRDGALVAWTQSNLRSVLPRHAKPRPENELHGWRQLSALPRTRAGMLASHPVMEEQRQRYVRSFPKRLILSSFCC